MTFSPFGDFLEHFANVEAEGWVWTYINMCSRYGVFHSDETKCILARPVNSEIPVQDLNELADLLASHPKFEEYRELTATPDAWHIIYASGDILGFFDLATHDLPKVIWQRNGKGEGKVYNLSTIKRRLLCQCPHLPPHLSPTQ